MLWQPYLKLPIARFTNIKNLTEKLKEGKAEKVRSDLSEASTPIDVFEFLAVSESHFPGYQFQGFKVDGFVQEINHWDAKNGCKYIQTSYE